MLNTSVVDCFVCPSTVCHQLPIQKATHKYILCAAYTLPSSITLDKLSAQFSCFRYFAILYLVLFAQIAFRPSDLSRLLGDSVWLCVPFAFAIKLGKTNGVKFMKLNFIHNLKMIIRYGTWNDGSRPPISFYLSPLSILVFLFRVSIIDESSKRFISKFTYTYVCTSYIVHTYTHSFHMHKLHFGGKNHNTHF